MVATNDRSMEAFASRRRASTVESIHVDYHSSYQMEEDIKSRVRSLLLSRNSQRPPRTPRTSDECRSRLPAADATESGFHHRLAKSIAKRAAQITSDRMSLSRRTHSKSALSDMDGARRSTQPEIDAIEFPERSLRTSSSAHDLGKMLAEPECYLDTLAESSPKGGEQSKKAFRLPMLVLQDKIEPDTSIKSCFEIATGFPGPDDLEIHRKELPCCPPCDPRDTQPSKYIVSPSERAGGEPSHLACFLAGCPPGRYNCSTHQRQGGAHLNSLLGGRHAMKSPTPERKVRRDEITISEIDKTELALNDAINLPSPRSSITSTDKFPHAARSQEVAAQGGFSPLFSTTVATNFSFPPPKSKLRPLREGYSVVPGSKAVLSSAEIDRCLRDLNTEERQTNEAIRNKESKASLKSQPLSNSLLSGASRSSRYRHALLKPSITEEQPVDKGLPISPALSFAFGSPEIPSQEESFPKSPGRLKGCESGIPPTIVIASVVENLTNLGKSKAIADDVKERATELSQDAEDETIIHFKCDENLAELSGLTIRPSPEVEMVNNGNTEALKEETYQEKKMELSHTVGECEKTNFRYSTAHDGGNSSTVVSSKGTPLLAQAEESAAEFASTTGNQDAEYWGFVPEVKTAVQDAVQLAVRKAVHDVVMPPWATKGHASRAYRKLVAKSLTEAAKDADEYIRQASVWNDLPSSEAASGTVIVSPSCKADQENVISPAGPAVPGKSECLGEGPPKGGRQGWKVSSPFSKGPDYYSIPDRQSSKNHVLRQKQGGTNSPRMQISPKTTSVKDKTLCKRSYEQIRSEESYKSSGDPEELADKALPPEVQDRRPYEDKANAEMRSREWLGRRNTVRWLRDLLSSSGPYEPRLTALPPRTRRQQNSSGGLSRSQTAPAGLISKIYLGATPNPLQVDPTIAKHLHLAQEEKMSVVPETFTRTINDIENLLNEALALARQAADRRGCHSDEVSDVVSIHESLRSFSGSDSDASHDTEFYERYPEDNLKKKSNVFEPKVTQHKRQSGWPEKAQIAATPYPPRESNATGGITIAKQNLADDTDQIRAVDPRSKRTETQLAKTSSRTIAAAAKPKLEAAKPAKGLIISTIPVKFKSLDFKSESNSDNKAANSPGGVSPRRKNPEPEADAAIVDSSDLGRVLPSVPLPRPKPSDVSRSRICAQNHSEEDYKTVKAKLAMNSVPSKREVRDYILEHRRPPIHPRGSSLDLKKDAEQGEQQTSSKGAKRGRTYEWQDIDQDQREPCSQLQSPAAVTSSRDLDQQDVMRRPSFKSRSLDGSLMDGNSEQIDFNHGFGVKVHGATNGKPARQPGEGVELKDSPDPNFPKREISNRPKPGGHLFNLKGRNHVSLKDHHKGFSLARSHKRQTVARDWSPGRKRFVASVACISTALVGILVGIYAGETPAIQYLIVDFHHYTVLGNVFFFIGLAIPTFLFWPLPLLHGRKPYILGAMSLAMPLLFPQAVAVGQFRSPYVAIWRVGLILPRAAMGFCLGFANINFKATLTDLFGASLQSPNPHQEHVDENDVRRHGGGMGAWLGLWTWSALGSIGIGFMIGAAIINTMSPDWGFYVSILIIALVLVLNVVTPEVRRSAFRRSVAEVRNGQEVSRRLARGEVKMHMVHTGPKWWGEEFHYGVRLTVKMLKQPGFMVMAVYVGWIYGQMVLIILLLGSLMSNGYKFKSPEVGASTLAIPLGALVAMPFQKASWFSRDHSKGPTNDDETFKKKISLSDHVIRRLIFILTLPFAGLAYTLSSGGPPTPFILPILFAGLIGFLSNLAMAECHGIIMETFDTSDLQPGMTGRSRGSGGDKTASKRTNYSSFPRVAAAFGITQGIGYIIAAAASGVGGALTRRLGQQSATGVMAGILLILSLLLLGILTRFQEVQIIPDSRKDEMEQYHTARRVSATRRVEGEDEDEPWRPIIIGNPHHITRRMNVLELGSMSRFSEIRKKNRLVDEQSLEARHPNHLIMAEIKAKLKEKEEEIVHHVRRSLSRHSSRGSRKSFSGDGKYRTEPNDLGGFRDMSGPSAMRSGKGSAKKPKRRTSGIQE